MTPSIFQSDRKSYLGSFSFVGKLWRPLTLHEMLYSVFYCFMCNSTRRYLTYTPKSGDIPVDHQSLKGLWLWSRKSSPTPLPLKQYYYFYFITKYIPKSWGSILEPCVSQVDLLNHMLPPGHIGKLLDDTYYYRLIRLYLL